MMSGTEGDASAKDEAQKRRHRLRSELDISPPDRRNALRSVYLRGPYLSTSPACPRIWCLQCIGRARWQP